MAASSKHKVLDRGHVEIDGVDYAPGSTIPASVKVAGWLVEQLYVAATGTAAKS
tara:strand:+ start:128 stop:289 length:162 start_codon:yes stop_codon:yes gene_type:complete